jgi:hypothetical protein
MNRQAAVVQPDWCVSGGTTCLLDSLTRSIANPARFPKMEAATDGGLLAAAPDRLLPLAVGLQSLMTNESGGTRFERRR